MPVKKNSNKTIAFLSWAAVLIWMLGIFVLSAQVAEQSDSLSTGITEAFIGTVEDVVPEHALSTEWLNHIIRKNAHFITYLVLGVLVSNALRSSGVKGKRAFVLAFVICVLYAVSDELHQLFVPGRGGKVSDVLLDSSGAFIGIAGWMSLRK